jgi:hypothetical protein
MFRQAWCTISLSFSSFPFFHPFCIFSGHEVDVDQPPDARFEGSFLLLFSLLSPRRRQQTTAQGE